MQAHTAAAVPEHGRGGAGAAPGTWDEHGPPALVADLTSVLTAWAPTTADALRSPLMAAFSSACVSLYAAAACATDGGTHVHCPKGKPGLGGGQSAGVAGHAHPPPNEQPTPVAHRQHRPHPQAAPAADAAACFSRPMTCEMTLRVLNIPKPMHLTLGLADAYPYVKGRRSNRCTIHIRSPDGARHPVTMTQVPGTPYRRFTAGWRSFCCHAGVRIGDTVHFRRAGGLEAAELEACVTRGGGARG